jgi:integrase
MASIFKKPRSPFWFAAFRDSRGLRCQRTTKTCDRSKARTIALEWERAAESGRNGALTEAACRKVLGEILERATGETLHFKSCREWLVEWVAGKQGATAAITFGRYRQVIADFLEHLGNRAEQPLGAVSPRDVRSFRDALAKGGRSPVTCNQVVRKVLSAPFGAALRLGYITMNPCAAVESLRDENEGGRETFTAEQVRALLAAAEGDWKGAILCGYFTGLRLRDVAELKWEAVDFNAGLLRVRARKTRTPLVVPLHPEFVSWLKAQPRGIAKAPVFRDLAGKGTGGRYGLSGRFKAVMERAGIVGRIIRHGGGAGRQTSNLSFHSLRHGFVSALANAGVAAELRQELSGHADERSHARYTHHKIENLRAAVAKLPGIGSVAL